MNDKTSFSNLVGPYLKKKEGKKKAKDVVHTYDVPGELGEGLGFCDLIADLVLALLRL